MRKSTGIGVQRNFAGDYCTGSFDLVLALVGIRIGMSRSQLLLCSMITIALPAY